ncbi:MAG: metal ABC transporter substrate-binding protein, partial [Acidimicrobiia bacterium]|nr:metal ABC transporter substrate-binding protein [Acidimicrobiia bacterium]
MSSSTILPPAPGRLAPVLLVPVLLVAVLIALLAGCGSTDSGGSVDVADGGADAPSGTVLVTTSIWADVVANATCSPQGAFPPLIPPGADPHEYQPSIADAEAMEEASVIIANGGGLEESLVSLVDQAES